MEQFEMNKNEKFFFHMIYILFMFKYDIPILHKVTNLLLSNESREMLARLHIPYAKIRVGRFLLTILKYAQMTIKISKKSEERKQNVC